RAVDELAEKLDELAAEAGEPWKRAVLALVADAVEQHGPAGLLLVQEVVDDLTAGKAPDIDWANPRTASDVVAQLQNAEAGRRSAARDFAARVGDVVGRLLVGIVRGLAAE
ncbi:MAG: hypothetical protein KC583_13570, partial [Myxococcales bacterium]|nr:hypothetical protein [Myxococcales bacterium]